MPQRWEIPQGLRILENGQWRVGELDVVHPPTLRHLKAHLVVDDTGAFIEDGARRMPIEINGPPFVVVALVVDAGQGRAHVVLDDGSEEPVRDTSLGMDDLTGRFECRVRKASCPNPASWSRASVLGCSIGSTSRPIRKPPGAIRARISRAWPP